MGGGIALIVFTGGLATTVVVPALLWGGTAVGVAGGATKITGTLVCQSKLKAAVEELVELVKKDVEANDALMKLEGILERIQDRFTEGLDALNPIVAEFVRICGEFQDAEEFLTHIQKEMPPLELILARALNTNSSKSQILNLLLQVINSTKSLLGNLSTTATAPASAPASIVASTSASTSGSSAASTAVSSTSATSTAASTVASASTEVADDVAVLAVKETAAGGARTAALVAGGVSVGIGVAVAGWEIYQIVKKAKEKCEVAEDLRKIANDLQEGIVITPEPSSTLAGTIKPKIL